jgi:hypothetical protein
MKDANCGSVKILTTNFLDDYGASIKWGEQFGADVDIWGVNIYDKYFDPPKIQLYTKISSRPYLFSGTFIRQLQ